MSLWSATPVAFDPSTAPRAVNATAPPSPEITPVKALATAPSAPLERLATVTSPVAMSFTTTA